jgi:amino acid adenylation domain-containing protein/non-ribosomal peptide synthase protein (TIGR01720 family)
MSQLNSNNSASDRASALEARIAALPPEKRALFYQQLAQQSATASESTTVAIPTPDRPSVLPLSIAQERLWFWQQLYPQDAAYNIAMTWTIVGNLDVARLEKGLNAIVQRHETLRTLIKTEVGQAQQVILPELAVSIALHSLASNNPEERRTAAISLGQADAQQSFDLSQAPLFRATLVAIAPQEWQFFLTFHHSIADGWSRGLLLQEMALAYRDLAAYEQRSALPVQYADYAIWQRQWLDSVAAQQSQTYWQQQLAGLEPLQLATDFAAPNRPLAPNTGGTGITKTSIKAPSIGGLGAATVSRQWSTAFLQQLKAFSQGLQTTSFTTLLTGFQILLHHHSGQTDIAVGVPVANRELVELRSLIGFFVNTIVVRQDLAEAIAAGKGFQSLVQQNQATIAAGFEHQRYPFAKVVEQLQPDRDRVENPLFSVMFQLQNAAYQAQNATVIEFGSELQVTQTWRELGSTKFDLTWHGIEQETGLLWVIEYRTAKFTAATIATWLDRLEILLQSAMADVTKPISQLDYLLSAERQQLMAWGKGELREVYGGSYLLDRVRTFATQTPDAIALHDQQQTITYRELLTRSQQLAADLRSQLADQPPNSDPIIGLQMPRSVELVIAILAVWQAGAAYLPLDQTLPPQRLQYILQDANPAIVLTQADVDLTQPIDRIGEFAQTILPKDLASDDLAYVIYTSGSTGQPKGTLLTHQGLNNYLAWCEQAYPLAQGIGAPVQSAIGFDATITSLFAPLLVGKTVVLLSEGDDLAALQAIVAAPEAFSFAKVTPAHLEILATLPAVSYPHAFVIGGEALSPVLVQKWQAIAPQTRLFNEYGPTETVVGCSVAEVLDSVTIGRPIPGVQLYVLDPQQQLLPVGVAGELYIGGLGVARGYLNQPELTAARFIKNPFGSGKLYRTGDRVKWRNDGQLDYLGRFDNQVKLRGYRIELGEIEAALWRCLQSQGLQVAQAIVLLQPIEADQERSQLVAYYSRGFGGQPDITSQLRSQMAAQLPNYMLPSHFIQLDQMPLTVNGKIDREALPRPTRSPQTVDAIDVNVASSPIAQTLLNIWQDLLQHSALEHPVQPQDNFFELGGDSILALQMVAQAQMQGIALTPQQLFEHQTIAQLSIHLTDQTPAATIPESPDPLPLTPIQQWFFVQNLHDWHHYHQVIELPVIAGLDAGWLEAAMQQIRSQHGALRLRFFPFPSQPQSHHPQLNHPQLNQWQQQILPAEDDRFTSPIVELHDLTDRHPDDQSTAMQSVAQARSASLDPVQGDLLRVLLFRLGECDRLVLIGHHLAIDGLSWRILLGDLALLYQQHQQQQPLQLPPPTAPFSAWVDQLTIAANAPTIQSQLTHWLQLPANSDNPESIANDTVADEVHYTTALDPAATTQLLNLLQSSQARSQSWRMEDLLLGAIVEGMSDLTGTRQLRVDLEQMGRDRLTDALDWSRTIGWFTSLYPVELDLRDVTEAAAIISTIHQQTNPTDVSGISYGLLRYLATMDETAQAQLTKIPISSVCFNYLGKLDQQLPTFCDKPRFDRSYLFQPVAIAQSPHNQRLPQIKINAYQLAGCLEFRWSYSQKAYSSGSIIRCADTSLTALQIIINSAHPSSTNNFGADGFGAARLDQRKLNQFLRKIRS